MLMTERDVFNRKTEKAGEANGFDFGRTGFQGSTEYLGSDINTEHSLCGFPF